MNDKQKIFVMVCVGSLVVLLLTLFATDDFDLKQPFISINGMGYDTYMAGVRHTNWFGMIAAFNIVVSITGFFLFRDK